VIIKKKENEKNEAYVFLLNEAKKK
jgi:hypothetical protein